MTSQMPCKMPFCALTRRLCQRRNESGYRIGSADADHEPCRKTNNQRPFKSPLLMPFNRIVKKNGKEKKRIGVGHDVVDESVVVQVSGHDKKNYG